MSYRKVLGASTYTGALAADSLSSTGDLSVSGNAAVTGNTTITGNASLQGIITYGATQSITANADANQANATALTEGFNFVATCAANGNGVGLPAAPTAGQVYTVYNGGAFDVGVFPGTGDTIDSLSANVRYYLHPGCTQHFFALSDSAWRTLGRGMRYIKRGDPSAHDFAQTDLTMDSQFNSLALTSIIPPSAYGKLLHMRGRLTHSAARELVLKQDGQTNAIDAVIVRSQVANDSAAHDFNIVCSSAGAIAYQVASSTTAISLTVRGWWVETA